EAADVDRPQIHGRLAPDDPLRERAPGAARGGDAVGVEARADEEAGQLRRLAEDERAVGREGLGAVDELDDADVLERGDARERLLHERLEVLPVRVEELEVEVARDP